MPSKFLVELLRCARIPVGRPLVVLSRFHVLFVTTEGESMMSTNKIGALACAIAIGVSAIPAAALATGIQHSVHVGTPDACFATSASRPGCDANYSATAVQFNDGTVTGVFTDRFLSSVYQGDGFYGTVRCLFVDGNVAVFSGTGLLTVNGVTTERSFAARVVDNGVSADDPPDQISYAQIRKSLDAWQDCEFWASPDDAPDFWGTKMLDAPAGQVRVK
jgi:hypothetical protein